MRGYGAVAHELKMSLFNELIGSELLHCFTERETHTQSLNKIVADAPLNTSYLW